MTKERVLRSLAILTRVTFVALIWLSLYTLVFVFVQTALLSRFVPVLALGVEGRSANVALSGFHEREQDGSVPFRWSDGAGRIQLDMPSAAPLALTLHIGAAPPGLESATLQISHNAHVLTNVDVAAQARQLHVLLPGSLWRGPELVLELDSATVVIPPDTRTVGVRFSSLILHPLGTMQLPAIPLAVVQAAVLGLLTLIGYRLGLPRWSILLWVLGLAVALCVLVVWQPQISFSYSVRLMLAMLVLVLLSWLILPVLEAQPGIALTLARALWGLTILALLVRLIRALYPLYSAHDLALNVERFERTIAGTLISSNRSFEFRSGVTIYPPGSYLAMQPAVLLGIPAALIVQAGNAIIDGLGALAVGLLALRIGASQRVALFSTLLYAALPVMLTSLYWGHSAQIFGQAMMVPLTLALLTAMHDASKERASGSATPFTAQAPNVSIWGFVIVLLAIAFLSHIGVTILALAWLGLSWLLLSLRRTLPKQTWRQLTIALFVAGLIGLVFVYGPALAFKLDQTAQVGERVSSESYVSRPLIWRAFQISFYSWGLPLAIVGLLWAPRVLRLSRGAAELLLSWLLVAALFCIVELLTGLQVRYFVFLAPLACIMIALALDWLAIRGRPAAWLAWALALLIVVQGASAWYNGVFNDIQMSMVPLLR